MELPVLSLILIDQKNNPFLIIARVVLKFALNLNLLQFGAKAYVSFIVNSVPFNKPSNEMADLNYS